MSGLLRRLADWIDTHLVTSAGRVHSSELDGIQHRDRDLLYVAVGPVAVIVDLPERWTRPRPEPEKRPDLNDAFFATRTSR